MSRAAIAAALALDDVAGGERLVAFSLASFANREHLAWPGTPAAAARAGLASQPLPRGAQPAAQSGADRDRRARWRPRALRDGRCCVSPTAHGSTGRSTPSCSRPCWATAARRSGAAAARVDRRARRRAAESSTGSRADELCAAAGLSASTYRRARNALIASGELELVRGVGGRGRTNRWRIADLRVGRRRPAASRPQRRVAVGPGEAADRAHRVRAAADVDRRRAAAPRANRRGVAMRDARDDRQTDAQIRTRLRP